MARSGIAAARLALERGARVIVNDAKPLEAFDGKLDELASIGARFALSEDPTRLLDGVTLVVISPGVPITAPIVKAAEERGIELIGELEFAYRLSKGRLFAITGTNGKTTTTTLLSEIFKDAGKKVNTVGNIGEPYSGAVSSMTDDDYTVCEVSSFQMETAKDFHPNVSAVLNITEDHLNRHGTMDVYIAMKERMFANCDGNDFLILNYEDDATRLMAEKTKARPVFFSTERAVPYGAFVKDGVMVFGSANSFTPVCRADKLKILGKHNLANALAAMAMAFVAGIAPESIAKTLIRFEGVEHRIEFTRELDGVRFYNDSKGTNVDSTIQAVRAMDRRSVIILGGSDKKSDYAPLIDELANSNVFRAVLIGDTAKAIAAAFDKKGMDCYEFAGYDFEKAIRRAFELCAPCGNVLLSPACASFDMFTDYEHRGREFKRIVNLM